MKIDFEIQTKHGLFKDSINTPVELTEEQIESIKTERLNNWIAVIDAIHSGAYDKYIVTDAVEGEDLG